MALPETVTKEEFEKLPEVVRDHYKETDGKFQLVLVPKQKLDEFRTNNIALLKERDELKATAEKFKDLDPDKARDALDKLKKLKEKDLVDAGQFEELFTERVAPLKADLEKKASTEKSRADAAESRLSEVLIDGSLRTEALKPEVAARPSALTDIVLRAKGVWALKDGKPVAMKDGNVLYGKDGNPLTMAEWLVGLSVEAPHLFGESSGGGADPGQRGAAPTGKKRSEMSSEAKSEYVQKYGQEAYLKLPY